VLLDFGAGPPDSGAPISARLQAASDGGSAPIWNCRLLLAAVD
jgi:hypothetical protein